MLSCLFGGLYLMGPDWSKFRGYEDSCAWRFKLCGPYVLALCCHLYVYKSV